MRQHTAFAANHPEDLRTLSHLAFDANRLAKELTGRNRALAYGIKGSALSLLILAGAATANGIRPDATVGVDINIPDQPKVKLHVPLVQLRPAARAIIGRQIASIPSVSAMAERLRPNQLDELTALLHLRAA